MPKDNQTDTLAHFQAKLQYVEMHEVTFQVVAYYFDANLCFNAALIC